MIVDANVLLYAVDAGSPWHDRARAWLSDAMVGDRRVALPMPSLAAFARIATHPRVFHRPLTAGQVADVMDGWLAQPVVWVPPATERTAGILGGLVREHGVTGNLVPDAVIAALAVEHGLVVVSADADFGRFPEVTVHNPLRG